MWRITSKNNYARTLRYFKLCASFHSHRWIQTGVTVGKCPNRVKNWHFVSHGTLIFDGWLWKTNMAPLLCPIKLGASFHRHIWIQVGVTVQKRLNLVLTSVTETFDLWPFPFAWTWLVSIVITPENFTTIWWQEHCQKGMADGQTDIQRTAWSQLKINDWSAVVTCSHEEERREWFCSPLENFLNVPMSWSEANNTSFPCDCTRKYGIVYNLYLPRTS